METKNIKIDVPEGWEIDKKNSTFENIVFKKKEEQLPTKWEDFKNLEGYYVDNYCNIQYYTGKPHRDSKNTWPTKEFAEASVAQCQLIRYRDAWNKGWAPDWDVESAKFVILVKSNKIEVGTVYITKTILTFEHENIRDKFMDEFKDLIEIAKPLLA